MNFKKKLFYILTLFMLIALTVFSSSALPVTEILSDNQGRILSVAFRGDTAFYPENSLEGVLSAREKGADMVSVSVMKTKDGVFVLCEDETLGNVCDAPFESISEANYHEVQEYSLYDNSGELTEYKMATLKELLKSVDSEIHLILDINWEDKDGIYELLKEENALSFVSLRTKESARKIAGWTESKNEKPHVIGVYDGNIIFNAISHVNILSEIGMPAVQYQTKNYFNVMYGSWTYNNFSAEGKARAIAPMYSPDLCGQRSDSENGWNELTKKGFTVIETNNIEALSAYIKKNEDMRNKLSGLLTRAEGINTEKYSLTSRDNLEKGIKSAEAVLTGRMKSLDEAEKAYSSLLFYMNEMKISSGEETTKGALNITMGKVIATVLVGAAILWAQIFVQKLHRKKKK